jgi:hypothetical protein
MTAAAGWGLRPAAALTGVRSSPTAHLWLRWSARAAAGPNLPLARFINVGLRRGPGKAVSSHTEAISFSSEDDPHSCKSVKLARGEIRPSCYGNLSLLSLEMPEALIYYACADGGGCATK